MNCRRSPVHEPKGWDAHDPSTTRLHLLIVHGPRSTDTGPEGLSPKYGTGTILRFNHQGSRS